jgi:transcription elongation GreA/GreB family factor
LSTTSEYYLSRANENRRDAESATLDNVRDRCRRSEAAWREMADRVERGEVMRDTLAAEKAGRIGVPA